MATYVYRCKNNHRREVVHKMSENPVVKCKECGAVMRRVPQKFRFAFDAQEILIDWMDENYRRYRTKRRRFSPDEPKRPGKPIPLTKER
jgi:putative FmdB family regulatory protein